MNAIRAWLYDHLIPGARNWWRWWSLRLNAVGLAILTWVQFDPVGVLYVWNMMPAPVRQIIPASAITGLALFFFILAMIARLLRQPKLEQK